MPVSYTVTYRTIEGWLGSLTVDAYSAFNARVEAKYSEPAAHRIIGVKLTPIYL